MTSPNPLIQRNAVPPSTFYSAVRPYHLNPERRGRLPSTGERTVMNSGALLKIDIAAELTNQLLVEA
jgi:hypothetical protein